MIFVHSMTLLCSCFLLFTCCLFATSYQTLFGEKQNFPRMRGGGDLCNTVLRLASLTKIRFNKNEDHSITLVFLKNNLVNNRFGRDISAAMTTHLPNIYLIPLHYTEKFCKGITKPIRHRRYAQRTLGIVGEKGNTAAPMTNVSPDLWKTRFSQKGVSLGLTTQR